jgi:hypothetical protein
MSDIGVCHYQRALRTDAASYRSIRASTSTASAAFDTRIAVPPTRRQCLRKPQSNDLTEARTRAPAPRRLATTAKIPIPS